MVMDKQNSYTKYQGDMSSSFSANTRQVSGGGAWSQPSSGQGSPKVAADGVFRFLGLESRVDKENFDRFLKSIKST